jgi:3-oxoacyl-[acyl-carrier protein] reductase
MRLADKVAIVAGGGMGIGRACARLFAQQGARLVLCDIDPQAGREATEEITAERGQVIFVQADVSDGEQVQRLVQRTLEACGRIDILYSGVAIYMRGKLTDLDECQWDRIMRINVKSAYLLCKAVIPHMQQAGGGSIILSSSSVGWQNSAPNIAAYAASKFAITGLTKSLACELLADGIRVNCLCPGPTDTPMIHGGRSPDELQAFINNLPGKRLAEPLEIAEAALYLASDESRFITGVALPVDGGQTAWI